MYVYERNLDFAHVYDTRFDRRGYFGAEGRISYRINGSGLRGPDLIPAGTPNVRRLLLLGDSVTFGEGVRYEDTFGALLASYLEELWAPAQVQVINAGVQGYDTVQEVALYHAFASLAPEITVLVFFINDAMASGETIRWQEARMEGAKWSGAARFSRILQIWEGHQRGRQQQQQYLDSLETSLREDSPGWQACRDALMEFAETTAQNGSRGVIVIFPLLHELDGNYPFESLHRRIARLAEEIGCIGVDMLETLQGQPAQSLWVHPTDPHPNERAHALTAEAILQAVMRP